MNARIAVLENELMVKQLIEGARDLAERKGLPVEKAIDFKVGVSVKYAKTPTEAAAWEIRGRKAKELI